MKRKLTKRQTGDRYSVSTKTVERWRETGILPQPEIINGRWYFDEQELERHERERLAQQSTTAA